MTAGSQRLLQLQQDVTIVLVLLSTLSQHLEGEEPVTKLVASFVWAAANDYGLVAPITKGTIPMQNITYSVVDASSSSFSSSTGRHAFYERF